jgi:hypothetical protein
MDRESSIPRNLEIADWNQYLTVYRIVDPKSFNKVHLMDDASQLLQRESGLHCVSMERVLYTMVYSGSRVLGSKLVLFLRNAPTHRHKHFFSCACSTNILFIYYFDFIHDISTVVGGGFSGEDVSESWRGEKWDFVILHPFKTLVDNPTTPRSKRIP